MANGCQATAPASQGNPALRLRHTPTTQSPCSRRKGRSRGRLGREVQPSRRTFHGPNLKRGPAVGNVITCGTDVHDERLSVSSGVKGAEGRAPLGVRPAPKGVGGSGRRHGNDRGTCAVSDPSAVLRRSPWLHGKVGGLTEE